MPSYDVSQGHLPPKTNQHFASCKRFCVDTDGHEDGDDDLIINKFNL
jgi:hypothetical protein